MIVLVALQQQRDIRANALLKPFELFLLDSFQVIIRILCLAWSVRLSIRELSLLKFVFSLFKLSIFEPSFFSFWFCPFEQPFSLVSGQSVHSSNSNRTLKYLPAKWFAEIWNINDVKFDLKSRLKHKLLFINRERQVSDVTFRTIKKDIFCGRFVAWNAVYIYL